MRKLTSLQYEASVIEALKEKAKKANVAPLPEWVSEEGNKDRVRTLSDGLSNSYTEYMRSLSGYGRQGEELYRKGLSESGYSRYLDSIAEENKERDDAAIIADYNSARADEEQAYSEYIDEKNSEADESYYNAINSIVNMGILDYDTAYKQGLNLGFDEQRASDIAKSATTKLRFKLRSKVLNAIVAKKLNRAGTINLAISYGLDYNDALELGNDAKKINEAHSDTGVYPVVLVDQLKDLENKKRIEEEKKLNEK